MTERRQPTTARLDEFGRRLYTWTGRGAIEEFYSTTTMIGGGLPKHLVPWASKLVAELAYDDVLQHGQGVLDYWAEAGQAYLDAQRAAGMKLQKADTTARGLALRYLKGQPDRVRDHAADRGSAVHEASEDFVLARVREGIRFYADEHEVPNFDPEIAPYMASLVSWLNHFRPRILATEATVYNRTQSYAGTADLFAEVYIRGQWVRLCIDYKSGRAIWPDVAMQVCSYARGEFIGGPDNVTELEVPQVDGTAVLHLRPDGYSFKRLRYDDVVWHAFLFVREVFRWTTDIAKTAIGDDIAPDLDDALAASLTRGAA